MCEFHALRDILSFSKKEIKNTKKKTTKKPIPKTRALKLVTFYVCVDFMSFFWTMTINDNTSSPISLKRVKKSFP